MQSIKTILNIATILAFLFTSCVKRSLPDNEIGGNDKLSMGMRVFAPKAAVADGDIQSVRVIIFNQDGVLLFNNLASIKSITSTDVILNDMVVTRGLNNFYIFCNENEELRLKLANVERESDIEAITFQPSGVTPPLLPMYGKVIGGLVSANRDGTNVQVTVNGVTSSTLNVNVKRLMAKVNLTVIKNLNDLNTDFTVEELNIKIYRLPKTTPLQAEQKYTSMVWADNIVLTGEGKLSNNGAYKVVDGKYSIPDGVDRITFPDIYIPEHILTDSTNVNEATYMLVEAKCVSKKGSSQPIHSIYTINIGQEPPLNHNVRRNGFYNIYATIVGLGAMGLYAEIVAMDMYDIPVNWSTVEGLAIVSDRESDFDVTTGLSKNVDVWNDNSVYSGILKVYHSDVGYQDVVFKYGSTIAINAHATLIDIPFVPPLDISNLNDVLWYPTTYSDLTSKVTSWEKVPYVASGNIPVDNSKLSEGLGDPCKLAGLSDEQIGTSHITDNHQWHMATPADYDILKLANDNDANDYGYKAFHRHLLPNVRSRNTLGVLLAAINKSGNYWTSEGSQAFGFTSTTPSGAATIVQDPSQGFMIRCVRNSIPVSTLTVTKTPVINYNGNTVTGSTLDVFTNIPYWTATLIDDPTDPNFIQVTEFEDFSFAPGETNVKTASGKFTQNIPAYIKRREIRSERRFGIRLEGIGYDGQKITYITEAKQTPYSLSGIMTFDPILSKTVKIPKAGQTYSVSVELTPTDIALPAGNLQIKASYNNILIASSNLVATQPYVYFYDKLFTITIPPNSTPDIIGISFALSLNDIAFSFDSYYQDNK